MNPADRRHRDDALAQRQAAEWLRSQEMPPGRVATTKQRTAYYAARGWVPLSYGDDGTERDDVRIGSARYVIVDHSAAPGARDTQVKTLHRVEESLVREEIERAGFVLEATADFLRNPDDARDWNAAPSAAGARRGTSDRFVHRYVKPAP